MHEFVTYLMALFLFHNVGQMQGSSSCRWTVSFDVPTLRRRLHRVGWVRDGHFLSIRRAALNDGATELTVWVSRSSLMSGHFDGVTVELIFARDASGMWHFLKKSPTYRFSS